MTSARLAACPSCSRHVRLDEERCPFCTTTLPPSFRLTPAPEAPTVRLSRAALYAVGVGALSLSAAQACGGSTSTGGKVDGGATDAALEPESFPIYGAPPPDGSVRPDASGEDAGPEAGEDGGSPEASVQDGANDAVEDMGTLPIYGAPPPRGPGQE